MEIFYIIILFLIGSCFGSFYLVISTRLPKKENAIFTRSKCDKCHKKLNWYELIPLFSYLFLKGKCSKCKNKINPLNFIVELVTGFFFAFSYFYYGISYEMFMFIIVTSLLITIFITDFQEYIILDSPLIISSILIIILDLIYFDYKYILVHVLSGIGLFITMLLIKLIGDKVFKKESLGGGDIKLSFVIGLIVGFRLGLCVLILSTFLALPYSVAYLMYKKNNEVPFGPFLIASLFIVYIYMDKFNNLLNLILILARCYHWADY
ncbi:MAG: prepilin peptidase [Mollicutes bacterium]|nr:prepilin peptidase [Mollicutes bacterium]